jgi:hypothetical protein
MPLVVTSIAIGRMRTGSVTRTRSQIRTGRSKAAGERNAAQPCSGTDVHLSHDTSVSAGPAAARTSAEGADISASSVQPPSASTPITAARSMRAA